ncbi:hypothetical protein AKJ16_DCAP01600, partial [Drosera capensis]
MPPVTKSNDDRFSGVGETRLADIMFLSLKGEKHRRANTFKTILGPSSVYSLPRLISRPCDLDQLCVYLSIKGVQLPVAIYYSLRPRIT